MTQDTVTQDTVSGTAAEAAQAALDLVPGDPRRASALAAQALELARAQGDRAAESMAHRALGLAAHQLGNLDSALTALRAAVRVAEAASLPAVAAQARMSRAFVLLSQGRTRAAMLDAEAAVASMRGVDRARALAQQGLILQRSGRLDDALTVYAAALPALLRHHDRLWEARLRNNRAMLHAYRGHLRRAKTDIVRSERLFQALELPRAQAGARWNLGVIEGKRGDIPAALTALDSAAAVYRKAGVPMASLLLDHGEVLLSAGLADEALAMVTAAVAELSQAGQAADLAEAHLLLARVQLSAGVSGPASASAAAARRGFTRQHRPAWAAAALYVEVHASWAGHRAATLRIRPVLPPPDETLADLRAALRVATDEAEKARLGGAPVQALSRRQHALEEQLRQRLRRSPAGPASPDGHPALLPAAAKAADIASALAGRVLIEYVESAGDLYAVIIGAGQPALRALGPAGPVRLELDSLRFAWRRLLTGHGSAASLRAAAQLAAHAAGRLDDALLAPLPPLPAGCPLVLVPPGSLRSLPWPMLPGCARRPVTVAPSAASWLAASWLAGKHGEQSRQPASPQPVGASRAERRVVLVAGPGLRSAATEIAALSEVYPGAQVLTGCDATVSATLRALDGADVAHVAAHGSFRVDNPLFSSLLLADGPLTVYDLERLDSAPRTIMLAACDSALSPAGPGDEMTGLAAALLAVGASAVIAPLLPLPDEVSARLAHGWHRRAGEGVTPAAALAEVTAEAAADEPLAQLAAAALVCLGYGG